MSPIKSVSNETTHASISSEYSSLDGIKKRATEGDIQHQLILAHAYYNGIGIEKNYHMAFKWYLKAAKSNSAQGLYMIARCYDLGHGVKINNGKAYKLFLQSANLGYAPAQYTVGVIMSRRKDNNANGYLNWLSLAAEQGYVEAQYDLASALDQRNADTQDIKNLFRLYKLAAEQDHYDAIYNLANCYNSGRGTNVNYREALRLYLMCYTQDGIDHYRKVDIMLNIADIYKNGIDSSTNLKKALHWYRLAANKGSDKAKYHIGSFYEHGWIVKRDITEALKWYYEAALHMNADAFNRYKELNPSGVMELVADMKRHGVHFR